MPWNKGSGLDFAADIRKKTIKPHLKEDLECSKASITFDEFLKRVPPEWSLQEKPRIEKIVYSKRYQDMLQRWYQAIHGY